MASANAKIGSFLGFSAVAIYFFTMAHLKTQAPGDLDQIEPLPPSEQALQALGTLNSRPSSTSSEPVDAKSTS
ncbi:hypothetical protein BWQ96_07633 [Gracilariopsis chorda]|uniref:Uncharacterized protein n=1 Tax=Gracilariopsis chorda TaxID=448386 RepID=A0A2V3IKR4_9FLOR|nr:hypothetical protein BWQ96_07633 [Gracilariopsis chorda]|eukprot:PXF42629.1 hypothetical protein BWQ96_07633 [Gracilariopsis chorda]